MVRGIPEELSTPVQCETDRTGSNGVVVYDDRTYAITSDGNHQPRDQAPVVYGELEWQQSSEEIHHQEQNLEFQPHGQLMCPVCLSEPTNRAAVLWWNKNVRPAVILFGVTLLLGILVYFIFSQK